MVRRGRSLRVPESRGGDGGAAWSTRRSARNGTWNKRLRVDRTNLPLRVPANAGSLRPGGGPGDLADPVMFGAAIDLAETVVDVRQRVIRRRCIAR